MLKKNLIANYVGQVWTALMGLVFVPVYIHYLGIESYGIIGLFALLQAWLSLLDMGMTPTLAREMARFSGGSCDGQSIKDLLRSVEYFAFGIAALIAIGIFLAANWLATDWLRTEKLPVAAVAQAFSIMGLVTALRFVESIYRSCIVGLQRQVLLNVVKIVFATLRGIGAIGILAFISPTISAFFIWQAILSLLAVLTFSFVTYHALPRTDLPARFSLDAMRNVWRFAGGMIGISILSMLLTQTDKLMLSKMLKLSEYGYYTLAAMVAGALYSVVGPITQAFFPRMSQLHAAGDEQALATTFHQGAQLVSVIAGSAAIVVIFFSDTLLEFWTRDATIAIKSARLVSLLALGNLLNILMWIPYQTQLAYGWTSLTIRINTVAVALIIPAIYWVTPLYGALGAACIWVALNAGYLTVGIHFMYRKILIKEKWRWYAYDVMLPLSAAVMTAMLVRLMFSNPVTGLHQFLTLATASILTLTAAAFSAPQIRSKLPASMMQFVNQLKSFKSALARN